MTTHPMKNQLTVRAYTTQSKSHAHRWHQLVLPLHGSIQITLSEQQQERYNGNVSAGECVVIPAGWEHAFSADEAARFLVADLDTLPDNLLALHQKFAISPSLTAFIHYVAIQLEHQVDADIEAMNLQLFTCLLTRQTANLTGHASKSDPRIDNVIAAIHQHIQHPHTITSLASIACLSPTQFKTLFKQQIGQTPKQYLTQMRIERAKALLRHTDTPIGLIAEQVGYQDFSAFSRRFQQITGQPPRAWR